jgi:hypothetical protein
MFEKLNSLLPSSNVPKYLSGKKCDTCTCYECNCEECTCECHEETVAVKGND